MLARTLLPLCLMLPATAAAAALPSQEGASYRTLFDDGVIALGAAEFARAAECFEAAGRLAPDALIWRTYLHRAREQAGTALTWPEATPAPTIERSSWEPVAVALGMSRSEQLSATGERLLNGSTEAALVDASTGRLVARLRSRLDTSGSQNPFVAGCQWSFDTTGRVVVAAGGNWGSGMGLDVRDASTGRPIEVDGAATLNPTPGARYTWFSRGEDPPECPFQETVDLVSTEGVLRCDLVPQADGGERVTDRGKAAVLNASGSLAIMRDQTLPTTLWVVDRLTEQVVLERSPAGYTSWFSPDGGCVYLRSQESLWKVELPSGDPLWEVPLVPPADFLARGTLTFRGDELMEVAPSGAVTGFDGATGARSEIQRLEPAPRGPLFGAKFVRGGARLIVLDFETTGCYDMATGKRLWARGEKRWSADPALGTVDRAEQRCMVLAEEGRPGVVSLETGEWLGVEETRTVATRGVAVVEGEEAAIVILADGELRRVDLATGATTARAAAVGDERPYLPRAMANGQLWTAVQGGALVIRDPKTLAPLRGALAAKGDDFEAFNEDGRFAVTKSRDPARTRLLKLTEDLQGEVVLEEGQYWSAAAFSPSGDRLAFVGDGRLKLVDGRTGELRFGSDLLEGFGLNVAAFHGEGELIVGMAGKDFDPCSGWVVDVADGHVIARLGLQDLMGGGTIMHIHSNPAAGVVVLTAAQSGQVTAFKDEGWTQAWSHETSGGNWGTLVVRHTEGAKRACISGMMPDHSRVFDLTTGELVRSEEARGFMDLALTSSGRYLVGIKDQRLAVKDGESFNLLYLREDATDGDAWILEGNTRRPAPGGSPAPVDPTHLIRDGWSAPISSFDAWIHDPLGLVHTSLSKLPRLPVILEAHETSGADGSRSVTVTGRSDTPVLGAVFQDAAGDETFVGLGVEASSVDPAKPLLFSSTPAGWVTVRLVARSGVLSRPIQHR